MPTDTIYGMVGRAQEEFVVNRIYKIRKRNPDKPCIILIGDVEELEKFSVILTEEQQNKIKEFWYISAMVDMGEYRATSIVLDCPDPALEYLHRGTNTLAFRLPALQALRDLLLKTGPLIAPSANPEGLAMSENIDDAKKYFGLPAQAGDAVDLYIDGGTIKNKASKLIKLHKDGSVDVLRN